MPDNVYVHIPFCKYKCKYCSFVSFPALHLKDTYIKALIDEINAQYKHETLDTLYIGGGTPSLLSSDEFETLISVFKTNSHTEITAELNPDDINKEYLISIKNSGVNRISIGCQTFDDNILKQIGRRHKARDIETAVKTAQLCGFDNISLDFIYGLPNQSAEIFENDIKKAVFLGIQHISLYGLKVEKGCYFYDNPPNNLADNDLQADMYLRAIEILTHSRYEHYEISNFSLKGFHSRHNLNYWENNDYYGFGIAAHGYENGIRYSNAQNFNDYFKNPAIHASEMVLTKQEKLEEEIFLGLRKLKGLNIRRINEKYKIDFEAKYRSILKKYTETGHLIKTKYGYSLSIEGILLSNNILSEFIE